MGGGISSVIKLTGMKEGFCVETHGALRSGTLCGSDEAEAWTFFFLNFVLLTSLACDANPAVCPGTLAFSVGAVNKQQAPCLGLV